MVIYNFQVGFFKLGFLGWVYWYQPCFSDIKITDYGDEGQGGASGSNGQK